MHSATKYLGGHSDVIAGALIVKDEALGDQLHFQQFATGATLGPMDSFLVLRGIKTLHIRMQRHCENGKVVANYLANHPKVGEVYWPGFESHKNHAVAKKQMKDFENGKLSLSDLRDIAAASEVPAVTSGKQEYLENIINRYI